MSLEELVASERLKPTIVDVGVEIEVIRALMREFEQTEREQDEAVAHLCDKLSDSRTDNCFSTEPAYLDACEDFVTWAFASRRALAVRWPSLLGVIESCYWSTAALARLVAPTLPADLRSSLDLRELAYVLDNLLYGEPAIFPRAHKRLTTPEEAAHAVVARLIIWLEKRTGASLDDLDWDLASCLAVVLADLRDRLDRAPA